MDHSNILSTIVQNSRLEMSAYGFEKRHDLQQRNRVLTSYSVSYMKSGSSRLHIYGQDFYATSGDVLIIPPYIEHSHVMDGTEETCFMWWNFTYKLYNMIDVLRWQKLPIKATVTNREIFESTFEKYLENQNRLESLGDYILRESRLFELIALLLEMVLPYDFSEPFPKKQTVKSLKKQTK